jgi:cobalamin synthase
VNIIDPKTGTLKLFHLLIANLLAVLLLTAVIIGGLVPAYPWGPLASALLFAANVVIVYHAYRQRPRLQPSRARAPKLLWLAAFLFTPAGIVAIVIWMRRTDLPSMIQALVAVLLVGYIWFLVYRLSRRTEKRSDDGLFRE